MLCKSLVQFSIDGQGCVPLLLFDLRPNYGGGNEDNGDLFQNIPCVYWGHYTRCPQPCITPPPTHTSPGDFGHSQASLGQSLVGSLLLSPAPWCTQGSLCPPRVYFPVLCKFWQLYGGVNGNLLQESLCHIQVCCTQSSRHCGSPLLTGISRGDAQTQFCLSLCGVSGSSGTQDSFEPSEHLYGNGV